MIASVRNYLSYLVIQSLGEVVFLDEQIVDFLLSRLLSLSVADSFPVFLRAATFIAALGTLHISSFNGYWGCGGEMASPISAGWMVLRPWEGDKRRNIHCQVCTSGHEGGDLWSARDESYLVWGAEEGMVIAATRPTLEGPFAFFVDEVRAFHNESMWRCNNESLCCKLPAYFGVGALFCLSLLAARRFSASSCSFA